MTRRGIPVCFVAIVIASCVGAVPASASCPGAPNTACADIPFPSPSGVIAGKLLNAATGGWDGGDFDCSSYGVNGVKLVRATPVASDTSSRPIAKIFLFDVIPGPQTTAPHHLEHRAAYPPTIPGEPLFDAYLKVDAGPEVLLPLGVTTIGEIRVTTSYQMSVGATGSGTGVPALGTTYRIVLGLSLLAGAIWLITRRSS